MQLINRNTYIKNVLPVHWRNTWIEVLTLILVKPIFEIIADIRTYKKNIESNLNLNSQVMVLEYLLNEKIDINSTRVLLKDPTDTGFDVEIFIPEDLEEKTIEILAKQYIIAGKRLKITKY